MKKRSDFVIWLVVTFIILLKYYFELPPLNLSSPLFWYFFFSSIVFILIGLMLSNGSKIVIFNRFNKDALKPFKYFIKTKE